MKIKNKKTGEIGNLVSTNWDEVVLKVLDDNGVQLGKYTSLAELNEEWEDCEEPKVYYYISDFGAIRECEIGKFPEDEEDRKRIGNYFETKEEAERAVEKLKAWKRLKNNGFKFEGIEGRNPHIKFYQGRSYETEEQCLQAVMDLDLLFGGEK